MNDEGIEVLYQPAAHSDADSFVLFRGSDVVVAGDVIDTTRFPVIDLANGGSIQGEIDALNKLIELAIAPTPFIYKGVGNVRDSRSRAALRADGGGGLPRHGGDGPRRDRGHDQAGHDARSDQSRVIRPSRMRRSTARKTGLYQHVCRGDLQEPDGEEIETHAMIQTAFLAA